MKLSPAQQRALAKLTDEWQPREKLKEHTWTLGALVLKGLADYRDVPHPESMLIKIREYRRL